MSEERAATELSLQFTVLVISPGAGRDEFHAHGERVMEELLRLEACNSDFTDSAVSTDTDKSTITVDLKVYDLTGPAALKRALELIRTAAHAAGAHTPSWGASIEEDPDEIRMRRAELLAA